MRKIAQSVYDAEADRLTFQVAALGDKNEPIVKGDRGETILFIDASSLGQNDGAFDSSSWGPPQDDQTTLDAMGV